MNSLSISKYMKTRLYLIYVKKKLHPDCTAHQFLTQKHVVTIKPLITAFTPEEVTYHYQEVGLKTQALTLKVLAKKKKKKFTTGKKLKLSIRITRKWAKKIVKNPNNALRYIAHFNFRKAVKFTRKYTTRKRRPLKFLGKVQPKQNTRLAKKTFIYSALNPASIIIDPFNPDRRNLKIKVISIYMRGVIKAFLGYSTDWLFVNPTSVLTKKPNPDLIAELYKEKKLSGLFTSKKTFILWYIHLVLFRDATHLSTLMFNWLYKANIKTHKKLFFSLIRIFDDIFPLLKKHRKVLGYFIYFKGKLAKKGSVRKEKIFKKMGRVATGTKNLRGNIVQYQAPTLTGTIGAAIGVFFKVCLQ